MERFEQQINQEVIDKFQDLRGLDLSEKDLSSNSIEALKEADFDTATIWPEQDRLPDGFSPEKTIEDGKNPGLGIRELHEHGIDGRGVKVAIIDQSLSAENGELMPHSEYAQNIVDYKEYGNVRNEEMSMHGPAVASLLVGKECGVAPGAELVYKATPSGRDFNYKADALLDIIKANENLPIEERVRVISCSIGYWEDKSEPGQERWIEAIKKAEEGGIMFVDTISRNGFDFIGGGASNDKEDIDDYNRALFLSETEKSNEIIIPSDYRTMASNKGDGEYVYNGKGGMSWAVPYSAGLFALALQVNPDITKEEIADAMNETVSANKKGLKIVDPKAFIDAVRK